jgi:hypothetical protein
MDDRTLAVEIGRRIRGARRRSAKHRASPRNTDRSLWGELAMVSFALVTDRGTDLELDPNTVLVDLLADLMHWCDGERKKQRPVDFGLALEHARTHHAEESGPNIHMPDVRTDAGRY